MAVTISVAVLEEVPGAVTKQVQGPLLTMLVVWHESDGSRLKTTDSPCIGAPRSPFAAT
jgi:hypothetical protein